MSEQWSLFVLVVAVGAGLVTATISARLVHSRQTAFFWYFLLQTLLFNLLILGGLVSSYVDLQYRLRGMQPHPALLPGLLAALGALKLGWLWAFTAMILALSGQQLPAAFLRRLGRRAVVLYVAWFVLLAAAAGTGSTRMVNGLLMLMELGVLGGASAVCVHLMIRAGSLPPGPRHRSISILGTVYLGIFAVMVGSLTLGWLRTSGRTPSQLLFNSALLILYNLLPLAWVLRLQPVGPIPGAEILDRFGITSREREIIDLICLGVTNQEIANRLFISLATVKDHNYNIFRKTGVRNRVELVNLMRARGASEGRGDGDENSPQT